MAGTGRIFRLGEAAQRALRFVSGGVQLAEGKDTGWVTLTRTGSFTDPRYGRFEITRTMLDEMVRNFEAGTYGQRIFVDVSHKPQEGAAGEVLRLVVEGDRLRALVQWTDYGREAIARRGFAYMSAEFHENWTDNETETPHGCVLLGAGLVTRPCIKRLDPVTLSEGDGGAAVVLHPKLLADLIAEIKSMKEKYLTQLRARLEQSKLAKGVIDGLVKALGEQLEPVTDEAVAKALTESFEASAKALEEQVGGQPASVTLQIAAPAAGLSLDDVKRYLSEQETAAQAQTAKVEGKRKLFADALAEAGKSLSEDVRRELADGVAPLLTVDTSDETVKALAVQQAKLAGQVEAAKQLAQMGYGPVGAVHIQVPDEAPNKLAGMVHEALKRTRAVRSGALRLTEPGKENFFLQEVMGLFDRTHGHQLGEELKLLSGGSAQTSDYFFPAGIQREVIRVALSDLNVMQLVQTSTDPTAQMQTLIPFEVRPEYNAMNGGVVYEGQAIPRYQTTTDNEAAWITPMKIGMEYSNELRHFTTRGMVNWDAVAENLAANSRTMRELISMRIANEMQRAADSYLAVAVVGEDISAQLTGANALIKTANFPVVRPFQAYNIKGEAQGAAEYPITLVVNGAPVAAWDGTGTQAAGTYWRPVSYNLGYLQLVDETGEAVTPAAAGACTIGYGRVTNVAKFDLDAGADTYEKHLNGLLQAVGARKAMLSGQRYVAADFLLMSPTLNDVATNAEQFTAQAHRGGTDTTMQGDLARIKGVPAFGTNQPGIDLGDERILMGPRGLLGYTISKPYAIEGQPFEVVDAQGRAIGKKQIYGEEYNAIHVPRPVRGYMTSVLAYSASGR